MDELISESTLTARKSYRCEASEFLVNACGDASEIIRELKLDGKEAAKVRDAESRGWRIEVGRCYIKQTAKYDGVLQTFRAIPAMHNICLKYDIYEIC